jgi:hypothetical protein
MGINPSSVVRDDPCGSPISFDQGSTVKVCLLTAVPPGVVTEIVPVVASAGTVAVMNSEPSILKVAAAPLNFTAVAPMYGP